MPISIDDESSLKRWNCKWCWENYDTNRERRFSNSIRLPHIIRPRYRICVYGDEAHCDEARANHIACMSVEDLKRLNKNRKKIRQLEHRYDVFLASESLIRLIPRLLGPGLGRVGKFPTLLTHQETLAEKIEQIKSTLRVRMKKQPLINVPIGHVQMTIDQLLVHLNMSINFIIGLLRKHWQHVGKIFLKSTMGKSFRLYWKVGIGDVFQCTGQSEKKNRCRGKESKRLNIYTDDRTSDTCVFHFPSWYHSFDNTRSNSTIDPTRKRGYRWWTGTFDSFSPDPTV